MKKEAKEEAVAQLTTMPDNLKDMKDLVKEFWSENLSLLAEVRRLRYIIAELKYEHAVFKAECKVQGEVK